MGPDTATLSEKTELNRLRENQARLIDALQVLYDLLEAYAPTWYTEEHHDLVSAALSPTDAERCPFQPGYQFRSR